MDAPEITKVQELIYTTKVEAVMASNVIVVTPQMSMSEAKALMERKHISGAPVMDGDNLVGMVSMSDVIGAMERGSLDSPVMESMTREVNTILSDVSAIEAVNNLGREGHSRLPVVDHQGRLVGIVTTGTLVRALLHEMDVSFMRREKERLPAYRASHIFEDVVSDDTSLVLRFVVDDKDFDNAGKASSMIKRSLQRLGVLPQTVRRVSVAVYEAEMNLVIHTDVGGVITVDIRRDKVKVSTADHGPGIENLELVLQPGFSTAPEWIRDMGFGAGMGLANIKRCSDMMTLLSEPGRGTRLEMSFDLSDHANVRE